MGDPIHPQGPRVKHVLLSLSFSSYRCLCTFSCCHLVLIGEEEEKEEEEEEEKNLAHIVVCIRVTIVS